MMKGADYQQQGLMGADFSQQERRAFIEAALTITDEPDLKIGIIDGQHCAEIPEELFGIGQHSARASSKVLPLVTSSREAGRAMLDRAIPGRPNAGMTRHIPLRESIV